MEEVLMIFTTNIENVNSVILKEVQDVTMRIKIKDQCNKKIYYEKNKDNLLQKQNDYSKKRSTDYKELQRSYVELQNKIKALEEKLKNGQVYLHISMYVYEI